MWVGNTQFKYIFGIIDSLYVYVMGHITHVKNSLQVSEDVDINLLVLSCFHMNEGLLLVYVLLTKLVTSIKANV